MSSFYFYYSSMNAGKSAQLLQSAYNYEEFNKKVLVLKNKIDNRDSENVGELGLVSSRIGIKRECFLFSSNENLFEKIKNLISSDEHKIHAVFIDEAQFLTKSQVWELSNIVDDMNIPVLCYGLRNNAFGVLFEGSQELMNIADNIVEIKAMCQYCDKKANMVFRVDEQGNPVKNGNVIDIGGNSKYHSCCRKHWKMFMS